MISMNRRTVTAAVLALGLLSGSGPLQAVSSSMGMTSVGPGIAQAKTHKSHKNHTKHRRRATRGTTGSTPPPGGDPTPQFASVTRTFTHPEAVGISPEGPSLNYPAGIVVDGLAGGTITDVNVRFPGFQHDFPDDVDMLLVGPQGQTLILLSDVGGDVQGTVLFDLTLDDEAGAFVPGAGPLSTGVFRPTNAAGAPNAEPDGFPAPAPAPSSANALAVFDGTAPNGTWNLFIVDDAAGDGGVLIGGWSLTITATVPL